MELVNYSTPASLFTNLLTLHIMYGVKLVIIIAYWLFMPIQIHNYYDIIIMAIQAIP